MIETKLFLCHSARRQCKVAQGKEGHVEMHDSIITFFFYQLHHSFGQYVVGWILEA